jgi:hypothetical protein
MLGRIGRNENTQLIVFTLAILLYLLIQVAEAADQIQGSPESSDQWTVNTASSDSTSMTSVVVEEGRQQGIDQAVQTGDQE